MAETKERFYGTPLLLAAAAVAFGSGIADRVSKYYHRRTFTVDGCSSGYCPGESTFELAKTLSTVSSTLLVVAICLVAVGAGLELRRRRLYD